MIQYRSFYRKPSLQCNNILSIDDSGFLLYSYIYLHKTHQEGKEFYNDTQYIDH